MDGKFDIKSIKFNEDGLVPAVTIDAYTNAPLMQAYMNAEALEKTLSTQKAYYYSRSRKKLWLKGETSGHFQEVVSIASDCDNDCVLLRVIQTGAACHTGKSSCFFNNTEEFRRVADIGIIQKDIQTIKERKAQPQEGSYTNYLLSKGREKICKKIGEESAELIIAAMKDDGEEIKNEFADLLFHALILLEDRGIGFNDVLKVLEDRRNNKRIRDY